MNRTLCCILLLVALAWAFSPPAQAQAPPLQAGLLSSPAKPAAPPSSRLLGLVFDRPAAAGGETVKLTLRLTHPAPAGGLTLLLKSSDKVALPLPSRLTIPARASAIGLSITPRKVSSSRAVVVQAAELGEVTTKAPQFVTYRTAQLHLAPTPKAQTGGGK